MTFTVISVPEVKSTTQLAEFDSGTMIILSCESKPDGVAELWIVR